jgi:hypothetical protein
MAANLIWRKVNSDLTMAANNARQGVGPRECQALNQAVAALLRTDILAHHPQRETLSALVRVCAQVTADFEQKLPGGRHLAELNQALKFHIRAMMGSHLSNPIDPPLSGTPKVKSSWPGNSRIDPLFGVPNMGRD